MEEYQAEEKLEATGLLSWNRFAAQTFPDNLAEMSRAKRLRRTWS